MVIDRIREIAGRMFEKKDFRSILKELSEIGMDISKELAMDHTRSEIIVSDLQGYSAGNFKMISGDALNNLVVQIDLKLNELRKSISGVDAIEKISRFHLELKKLKISNIPNQIDALISSLNL
jgi:hypothetical protein